MTDVDARVAASVDLWDGLSVSNVPPTEVVGVVIQPESHVAGDGPLAACEGIMPILTGAYTQRLPRIVPVGIALEMLFTARKIDAVEAYRIGLVNKDIQSPELMNAAIVMAQQSRANAPLTVQTAKMAVWKGMEMPLADGLRMENILGEPLQRTVDVQEGIAAFAEKRKPRFKSQ